LKIPKR